MNLPSPTDKPGVLCIPRRCEQTAAILRVRSELERRGYKILDVSPIGVVALHGGDALHHFPDDRPPVFAGGIVRIGERSFPVILTSR